MEMDSGDVEDSSGPLLVDLGNDFFIVKISSRERFVIAPSEGLWIVGENYLHVQWWRPNFIADSARTSSLQVRVCFLTLPMD